MGTSSVSIFFVVLYQLINFRANTGLSNSQLLEKLIRGRKTMTQFCVDTNIFLHNLEFVDYLIGLPNCMVWVPYLVMQEIEFQMKGNNGPETEKLAKLANREMENWFKEHRKVFRAETVDRAMSSSLKRRDRGKDNFDHDDKILDYCKKRGPGAVLITNDNNLTVKVSSSFTIKRTSPYYF